MTDHDAGDEHIDPPPRAYSLGSWLVRALTNKERTLMRRYREELKQSRRLARGFRYRFDFQFQTAAIFNTKHGPRVRVDTVPDYVFEAGLGDP